jgi:hypothetical protein
MTVYTTLPTDDLNLAVTVTESNDMVTLNITPAAVAITSAVTSVNTLVGDVVLTTTQIAEGTKLYFTDARAQTVIDTNSAGFITPTSTNALSNKSGAISQWTNDSGYLTTETDSQTLAFSTPDLTISNGNSVDLTSLKTTSLAFSAITSTPTTVAGYGITDAFSGAYTDLTGKPTIPTNNNQLTNGAGYTTNTGTVTASSTEAFTNKSGAISQWTNDAGYTTTAGTVTPTSTDIFTNKSGAISQWTNDSGYLTAETDSQTLSFASPNLTISNGNSVNIGALTVTTVDGGTY